MSDFLPQDYEIPKAASNYTKFAEDETTRIRILPSWLDKDVIICYEYFDNRWEHPAPVRSSKEFETTPGIREWDRQKEVWNFKVWNYDLEQVQICNVPQKSIKEAIMGYYKDEDFGSPVGYDLKVTRTGKKLETKYNVIATPPKDFDQNLLEWKDFDIDWVGFIECEKDIFRKIEE